MRHALGVAILVCAAGLSACADDDPFEARTGPLPAPGGWRWESFGDAEVAVPSEWGHGTGDVAADLWCISDAAVSRPLVLRPGIPVESTCPGPAPGAPDPATLVEKAGEFVSMVFAATDPEARLGLEGDRMAIRLGAVLVRVQAVPEQRAKILETLHQISVDANGCMTSSPISAEPTRRPDGATGVADLREVRTVAACRYAIPGGRTAEDAEEVEGALDGELAEELEVDEPTSRFAAPTAAPTVPPGSPTLLSSVLLSGVAAVDAIRGVAAAPAGTGPDAEAGCADADLRAVEAIVLQVDHAGAEPAEVYLRYGGCRNGFDDGQSEHQLTRAAVAPFVGGANAVPSYGDELARILDDPDAPATSGEPEDATEEREDAPEESARPVGEAEEEATPEPEGTP